MFEKKYIFETGLTKKIRRFRLVKLGIILLGLAHIALCALIIIIGRQSTEKSEVLHFKNAPEIIAVFTGDGGRLKYATKLANKYKAQKIFVSGVYAKNNVQTLFKNRDQEEGLDIDHITIDYTSRNTIENILSTYHFLSKNPHYQKVLVLSHDYHLARIKMLNSFLEPKGHQLSLSYMGIKSELFGIREIKIINKEAIKLVRGLILMLFWPEQNALVPVPQQ